MPRKKSWAEPLVSVLENPECRPFVCPEDDSLLLLLTVPGRQDELQVTVKRACGRVVCTTTVFTVPPTAPQGLVGKLCRMSNESEGEFVVFPTDNYNFRAAVQVSGTGVDQSSVKACVIRLLERLGHWSDRMRDIQPAHFAATS